MRTDILQQAQASRGRPERAMQKARHSFTTAKSLIAANVYTQEQYPDGWELQE